MERELTKGEGRTRVNLRPYCLGSDLVLYIYNINAHLGAVAVGEYDEKSGRSSTSVITRVGHKDDAIAQRVAHFVSKSVGAHVCVIVGVHIDNITETEITEVMGNADRLAVEYIRLLHTPRGAYEEGNQDNNFAHR